MAVQLHGGHCISSALFKLYLTCNQYTGKVQTKEEEDEETLRGAAASWRSLHHYYTF